MSDVCREFGISPKTGYKVFNRYKDDGLEALTDRSRRPVRYANQLPEAVVQLSCSRSHGRFLPFPFRDRQILPLQPHVTPAGEGGACEGQAFADRQAVVGVAEERQ
ncbi:transposase IS481 family protein [Rhizobium sp. ERR 922]|nr:transposase IS481 family protein [Rhizobium sp. ERR 922]TWB94141.1 transposase IS481 family protein [Rhizobium sp. ERR 942]